MTSWIFRLIIYKRKKRVYLIVYNINNRKLKIKQYRIRFKLKIKTVMRNKQILYKKRM